MEPDHNPFAESAATEPPYTANGTMPEADQHATNAALIDQVAELRRAVTTLNARARSNERTLIMLLGALAYVSYTLTKRGKVHAPAVDPLA